MAATIALKEQTKNRMNFETGYLFCHVETKSSNICSGIFCFIDLFGMTSIVSRTVGADSVSAAEPCHYCKRPGSLASIDPCGAVDLLPYATAKCTQYKYTYPAHKNIFCNFFSRVTPTKSDCFCKHYICTSLAICTGCAIMWIVTRAACAGGCKRHTPCKTCPTIIIRKRSFT